VNRHLAHYEINSWNVRYHRPLEEILFSKYAIIDLSYSSLDRFSVTY